MAHCNGDTCTKTTSYDEHEARVCRCSCSTCDEKQEPLEHVAALRDTEEKPQRQAVKRESNPINAVAVIVVCGTIVFLVVWFTRNKKVDPAPETRASTESTIKSQTKEEKTEQPPQNQPNPKAVAATRVISSLTLDEAIANAKPIMEDGKEYSFGTYAMASWASHWMGWKGLQSVAATRYSLAAKDPDAHRGKRICMSGVIGEIRVEKLKDGSITMGGIVDSDGDVVRFWAAGSSGDLVKDSQARFCGIFTQSYMYENIERKYTNALVLVGLFDIPDNTR